MTAILPSLLLTGEMVTANRAIFAVTVMVRMDGRQNAVIVLWGG
jgi:hypothetical protein